MMTTTVTTITRKVAIVDALPPEATRPASHSLL